MITSLVASMVVLMSAQSTSPATAQAPSQARTEPKQIAEAAMKLAAANDMNGMFEFIGKAGPIEKEKLDATLKTIVSQRKVVLASYGKGLGYQFINECRRGESFSRVLFAEKREKMALRWEFIFYKPRDKWLLTHFFWDDTIKDFFAPC